MYSLLVSHHFRDWNGEAIEFGTDRFLEHTSSSIAGQLRPLSNEAIDCIRSWPCVLMDEGRAEELVRVARISELQKADGSIRLDFDLCPSEAPILNDHLFRIREKLGIDQFEFSRNHWAVKPGDLLSVLNKAGHEFDTSATGPFEPKPLPTPPTRASLIKAGKTISMWSHTDIDELLLEAGVAGLQAGRDVGGTRNRSNAIVQFAIENPSALTAENSMLSPYLVKRAIEPGGEAKDDPPSPLTQEVAPDIGTTSRADYPDRAPNRVFVVHGQNNEARTAVVSFLESIGLEGIVLHEQANMGRHLLTKFIQEAELVTFAVVLMTGDDEGCRKGETPAPRARQNVILELGYFLAHLGQSKVCALISPNLETPSDFDGIVYISMGDDQQWQRELKRELVAARIPVEEASG